MMFLTFHYEIAILSCSRIKKEVSAKGGRAYASGIKFTQKFSLKHACYYLSACLPCQPGEKSLSQAVRRLSFQIGRGCQTDDIRVFSCQERAV